MKTNGSLSRLKKPPKALSDFFVRQVLASVKRILTPLDCFHKSNFVLEILSHNIAREITRLPALLRCRLR